jgi:hypothetical protein
MLNLFRRTHRLVLIALLLGIGCVAASAQGFYATYQIDGGSYNNFIQTDASGFPGSGSCGGMNMWNSLNGNYVSGWAPADLESGTYGSDGVEYVWTYGFSLQYPTPYGGCASSSYQYTQSLGYAITYTESLFQISDADGNCPQDNACTNTNAPRCPAANIKEGFQLTDCHLFHETIVPIVGGSCTIGISTLTYSPGRCTI